MSAVKDLTGLALAYTLLGLAAALFGINAGGWWLAHHLAWWTYAAGMAGATLGWHFVKAGIQVTHDRKRAARARQALRRPV